MFPCVALRLVALHAAGDAGQKHSLPVHPNRFGQAHVQVLIVSCCCLSPMRWSQLGTWGDSCWGAQQDWGGPVRLDQVKLDQQNLHRHPCVGVRVCACEHKYLG